MKSSHAVLANLRDRSPYTKHTNPTLSLAEDAICDVMDAHKDNLMGLIEQLGKALAEHDRRLASLEVNTMKKTDDPRSHAE